MVLKIDYVATLVDYLVGWYLSLVSFLSKLDHTFHDWERTTGSGCYFNLASQSLKLTQHSPIL